MYIMPKTKKKLVKRPVKRRPIRKRPIRKQPVKKPKMEIAVHYPPSKAYLYPKSHSKYRPKPKS